MIDSFLTQTVNILGYTASTTGWGGTGAWTISSTLKGRVRYLTGREVYISDRESIQATHRLYVNATTGLTVKNRVQADGLVYDVKMVTQPINADFQQVEVQYLPDVAVTVAT